MGFSKLSGARGVVAASVLALAATAAAAEPPRVLADIPPVHALAARVMAGVGEPGLIVPPGASPHGYAMRPSEAAALEEADVVLWIGEALSPWLHDAIEAVAEDAVSVELAEAAGVTRLPYRSGGAFEKHGQAEATAHAQAAEAGHDHDHDHAPAEAAAHDHDHDHDEAFDSHLWLDPENAKAWLTAIAAALSTRDPANAATYFANAAAGAAELDALEAELDAALTPLRGRGFIVFHDAYQYFENRFGLSAAGSIALGDATQPSAARVAEIKGKIESLGATCVFSEPQFEPRVVRTVIEGTNARTGVLDPLGAGLPLGPDLYPTVLRNLVQSLRDCLG